MTQITRSRNLELIGLSEADLEGRLVFATGYDRGELLPPYTSEKHRQTSKRIRAYIKSRPAVTISDMYYPRHLEELQELPAMVEIVGGLVGFCVDNAVNSALKNGRACLVNPDLIFVDPYFQPFLLGKMMLQNILSENRDRRCLIYGQNLIFYQE